MKTFRYAMLSLVIAFMLTVMVDVHAYIRGQRGWTRLSLVSRPYSVVAVACITQTHL